jgi:Tol biopolymer transport system component
MSLVPGVRLGAYEILGLIGTGGMGEVYKARDTRLDRTVALKVLSAHGATDPDRRARFDREARAVAALNHPHICQLHDVCEAANSEALAPPIGFLVMEYLEGQTLEERLLRGPLPPADVLRYAVELADALDHAHRRGLVHRDVKPANVMLTKAGAKLLDFGISRLQAPADLPALSTVTTGSAPLTAAGTVLGTYPYMAPEQLTGHEADARSDIFAFGAVLYEMATGTRAFNGASAATLIGAILHTDPPPPSEVHSLVPSALDRGVARCLAKDPDDRWQSARDLMLELKWIADHAAPLAVAAVKQPRRARLLVVVSATLAVLAIAAAAFTVASARRASQQAAPAMRLTFTPPEGIALPDVRIGGPVTISPDGHYFAFAGNGSDGRQLLWIRALESPDAQPLAGTDGAANPFWSPDSRSIGFFAQEKLKKVQLSGTPPQTLCGAPQSRGGTWSRDDVIVFAAGGGHELSHISARGGMATAIPADGKNVERYFPSFLPDGRHFVYSGRPQKEGIYLAALDSSETTLVLGNYVSVTYVPGYLLGLVRLSRGGPYTLMAHPFDSTNYQLTGAAFPVADQVAYYSGPSLGVYSASETGALVYGRNQTSATQLIWFDRKGRALGNIGGAVAYRQPSLSPDEKNVAVVRGGLETEGEDLWLVDTTRQVPSRFTFYGNLNFMPVWSPDGTQIVFASPRESAANLFLKSATTTESEERLFNSAFNSQPTDWSPDGRFIVYASQHPRNGWDLMVLPMATDTDRRPEPLVVTPYDEHLGRVSPDGRWLAYVSDESGTFEVYVRRFREPGIGRRISTSGGTAPRWRADGRELFYIDSNRTLMSVPLTSGASLEASAPAMLFRTQIADRGFSEPLKAPLRANYAVTRDGRNFLIDTIIDESDPVPATIVLNWTARSADAVGRGRQ